MAIKVSREFLEQLLAEYNNSVEPSKRLALVEQGTGQKVETKKEKVFDTKDLYVCVYNGNCVGVFKKEDYNYYNDAVLFWFRYFGNKYSNLFSDEIGICGGYESHIERPTSMAWKKSGYRIKGATATCNMTKAITFENVRLDLKRDEKLDIRESGKATLSEIYEVLELAPEYLGLTQESKKPKI